MACARGLHLGLICLKESDLLTVEVLSQSATLTETGDRAPADVDRAEFLIPGLVSEQS